MHLDESFYAEVEQLAYILHAEKGNPLTGALDTWIEAEKIILAKKMRARKSFEGREALVAV